MKTRRVVTQVSQTTQQALLTFKRQAGMTLMEIIAALAIIAAVVVGALSLFSSAQSSNSAVTMLKDVIAVRSAVQQLYAGQGGYPNQANGNMNVLLNQSKKAPSDLIWQGNSGDQTFRTSWNGRLYVQTPSFQNNSPRFQIVLTEVPPDVCAQLVASAANGWLDATVGVTNFRADKPLGQSDFPISPTKAASACGNQATKITWTTLN